MNKMKAKMGDVPFKILAVDMGESEAEVKQFVSEVKPEFTILMDEDGQSIGDWKVFAAPSNFIVGPDGNIRYTLFGGVEWDSDELIEKIKAVGKKQLRPVPDYFYNSFSARSGSPQCRRIYSRLRSRSSIVTCHASFPDSSAICFGSIASPMSILMAP